MSIKAIYVLLVNLKVKFFVIKVFICIISHFFFCFPAFIYSSNCLSEKICVKDLLSAASVFRSKPVDNRKLRSQLRQLIYQIHNIMLLLPQLPDTTITLKLLIYTKENATVSEEFLETTQHLIAEPQSIDFDKVNTNIHTVKSSVQYKKDSNMTTI